jgi:hypothetical protein
LSVAEAHVAQLAGPLSAAPVRHLPRAVGAGIVEMVTPLPDEPWSEKRRRTRNALIHAFRNEVDYKRRTGANPWGRS